MRCFVGSRQVTDPRLLQQAHQKSGPFPPLALPSLGSTTTLSDPHLCRRLSASLRPLPSPMMGLPRLPASPFQHAVPTTPADQGGCAVDCFPAYAAFPVIRAGRHPQLHFRGLLKLHSRYGPLDCSTAKAAFVTRLRPGQLPDQAARQLPDQSTTLWVDPSPTGDTRRRGAPNKMG